MSLGYAVYGEMTADGSEIVLMGAGDPERLASAFLRMDRLTPSWRERDQVIAIDLTWAACVQLAREFGPAWRPQPNLVRWITTELVRRTATAPAGLSFELPTALQEAGIAPYPHQVAGAHLIALTGGGRAVLWDEMRTGKTITTVLGLREIQATWWPALGSRSCPIIVIAPASVITPWVQAFRDWWPSVVPVAWHGAADTRRRRAHTAGVYVTSWGTAAQDASDTTKSRSPLMHLGHAALVVDEAHRGKNPSANRTRAMERLARPAHIFVALTGTPQAHTIKDTQPIVQFLQPGRRGSGGGWLPSKDRMVERFTLKIKQEYGEDKIVGLQDGGEFHECMLGQWRWLALQDVIDTAPKVYEMRVVDIPAEWRKVYDDVEGQMLAALPDGTELPAFGTLQQLNQLQQLANAAADVATSTSIDKETGDEKTHYHIHLKLPSWKVDELLRVLEERPGKRVVVFAPSRQLIDLATEEAARAGRRVGQVVGGQPRRKRDQIVADFQAGRLDTLCATTSAGGEGITLNQAEVLVYLQRPWSLIESSQSERRTDGIGASERKHTEIIDIVAHNSVEQRIRGVLKDKGGSLSELVKDPRIVAQLLGGASVTKIRRTG